MKLAVMQPYLFPYIGYFQLISAADKFLIYDDVSYIKQGYINRNTILSANGPVRFTVPVLQSSSNKLISSLNFSSDVSKSLKTIEQAYSKATFFEEVFPLVRQALTYEDRSIASVCMRSYQDIFTYLGLKKEFKKTSGLNYNRGLAAQERIISLCHNLGADCYVNTLGGRSLYSRFDFSKKGIDLKFVNPCLTVYSQGRKEFVPGLSIIDVLMNCSPKDVQEYMNMYKLV